MNRSNRFSDLENPRDKNLVQKHLFLNFFWHGVRKIPIVRIDLRAQKRKLAQLCASNFNSRRREIAIFCRRKFNITCISRFAANFFSNLRQISAKYLSQIKKNLWQIFFRFVPNICMIFGTNLIFFVHNRKFL